LYISVLFAEKGALVDFIIWFCHKVLLYKEFGYSHPTMIVGSGKYFIHIQDENKFNDEKIWNEEGIRQQEQRLLTFDARKVLEWDSGENM